jgi:hypothetical protein
MKKVVSRHKVERRPSRHVASNTTRIALCRHYNFWDAEKDHDFRILSSPSTIKSIVIDKKIVTGDHSSDIELDMRRFDDICEQYAKVKDYLTLQTMYNIWSGQCCANDYLGWSLLVFAIKQHAATDTWQGSRCTSYFGQKMDTCAKKTSGEYMMVPSSERLPNRVHRSLKASV